MGNGKITEKIQARCQRKIQTPNPIFSITDKFWFTILSYIVIIFYSVKKGHTCSLFSSCKVSHKALKAFVEPIS